MTDAIPSRLVGHVPVLLDDVVALLKPRDGGLYVDGTFGCGGYSKALLTSAVCNVVAIDRDPHARGSAEKMKAGHGGRFDFIGGSFGAMDSHLRARGVNRVDGGIVLDLGVSSTQLDDASRGFSFRHDGPLDMRMETAGLDAKSFVNQASEKELAGVIRGYGEERRALSVARAIVAARKEQPISRTRELATIIRRVVKKSADGLDPATRTFQALRVHINNELDELASGLAAAEKILTAGGRLVVVSFHSLEDRIVKNFFRERVGRGSNPSRHRPTLRAGRSPSFRLLTARPVRPKACEISANPRARSARLRAVERTSAAPWLLKAVA